MSKKTIRLLAVLPGDPLAEDLYGYSKAGITASSLTFDGDAGFPAGSRAGDDATARQRPARARDAGASQ